MKIDNTDFNEKHFAKFSEEDFIKHELASVPDSYGTKEKKIAFLKMAYEKIKGTKKK
jgi:hypothetical protein